MRLFFSLLIILAIIGVFSLAALVSFLVFSHCDIDDSNNHGE